MTAIRGYVAADHRIRRARRALARSVRAGGSRPQSSRRRVSTAISASTWCATAIRWRSRPSAMTTAGARWWRAKAKALHHLSFGCYAEDLPRLKARIEGAGVKLIDPPPGFESNGFWFRNHEGVLMEIKVAPKVSPDHKADSQWVTVAAGKRRSDRARQGAAGAAAPALACADLHQRRARPRSSSTSARWACACPTAPPIWSPSCTASTAAITICWRW